MAKPNTLFSMKGETKMVTSQEANCLLVEDVLNRYERTWPEEKTPRDRARKLLQENLEHFLKDIQGPGAVGLYFDLDHPELKCTPSPLIAVPRFAGHMARQHLAYLLHEKIMEKIMS